MPDYDIVRYAGRSYVRFWNSRILYPINCQLEVAQDCDNVHCECVLCYVDSDSESSDDDYDQK